MMTMRNVDEVLASGEATPVTPPPVQPQTRGRAMAVGGLAAGLLLGFLLATVIDDADGLGPTETIVERWMSAIEAQDAGEVASLYSDDALWTDEALGDRFTGKAGVRRGWGIFSLRGFEIRELQPFAIARDSAVVRWTLGGTRSPFSGEPWEVTGLSALVISDGKITSETVYYDMEDLR